MRNPPISWHYKCASSYPAPRTTLLFMGTWNPCGCMHVCARVFCILINCPWIIQSNDGETFEKERGGGYLSNEWRRWGGGGRAEVERLFLGAQFGHVSYIGWMINILEREKRVKFKKRSAHSFEWFKMYTNIYRNFYVATKRWGAHHYRGFYTINICTPWSIKINSLESISLTSERDKYY